jgi:hypothetical protein
VQYAIHTWRVLETRSSTRRILTPPQLAIPGESTLLPIWKDRRELSPEAQNGHLWGACAYTSFEPNSYKCDVGDPGINNDPINEAIASPIGRSAGTHLRPTDKVWPVSGLVWILAFWVAPNLAYLPRLSARSGTKTGRERSCDLTIPLSQRKRVDEYARNLRRNGESNERLDGLAGWRKSPCFTDGKKVALEWAEALTHVDTTHAPDAAYEPLARHYEDKQVANITYAIALMNAWNRVAIGFRQGPEPRSAERRSLRDLRERCRAGCGRRTPLLSL